MHVVLEYLNTCLDYKHGFESFGCCSTYSFASVRLRFRSFATTYIHHIYIYIYIYTIYIYTIYIYIYTHMHIYLSIYLSIYISIYLYIWYVYMIIYLICIYTIYIPYIYTTNTIYIGKFRYTPMINSKYKFETLVWWLMKGLARN